MLTLRQGIFKFISRATALALLTSVVAACSAGSSTTPATGSNGVTPTSVGSPAVSFIYKYRTLDDPLSTTFTQLLGINRSKQIAGYYGSGATAEQPNKGFRIDPPFKSSNFTPENFPHSIQTQVTAINNLNNTAGFWVDKSNVNHGFIKWDGQYSSYTWPGANVTQLLGINSRTRAVGFYTLSGVNYAFEVVRATKQYTPITPPEATNVTASSINNFDDIVGYYGSPSASTGFLDINGTFTTLTYPGATSTMPLGINEHQDIVGSYVDSYGKSHGFMLSSPTSNPQWTSYDDPNGVGTTVINGINDEGDMVGFYVDSYGNTDGMLIARVVLHLRH